MMTPPLNTQVYTADDHAQAVQKLRACRIPFREVTLRTAAGAKPALELNLNAYILVTAGRLLTDN
jgi:hypothetical protein